MNFATTFCIGSLALASAATNPMNSEKTCAELELSSSAFNTQTSDANGSPMVCGASRVTQGTSNPAGSACSEKVTFDEAVDMCVGLGARLCTADELTIGETARSGCDLDFHRVWSGSQSDCGVGRVITQAGSPEFASDFTTQCTDHGARMFVRCCADACPTACSNDPCNTAANENNMCSPVIQPGSGVLRRQAPMPAVLPVISGLAADFDWVTWYANVLLPSSMNVISPAPVVNVNTVPAPTLPSVNVAPMCTASYTCECAQGFRHTFLDTQGHATCRSTMTEPPTNPARPIQPALVVPIITAPPATAPPATAPPATAPPATAPPATPPPATAPNQCDGSRVFPNIACVNGRFVWIGGNYVPVTPPVIRPTVPVVLPTTAPVLLVLTSAAPVVPTPTSAPVVPAPTSAPVFLTPAPQSITLTLGTPAPPAAVATPVPVAPTPPAFVLAAPTFTLSAPDSLTVTAPNAPADFGDQITILTGSSTLSFATTTNTATTTANAARSNSLSNSLANGRTVNAAARGVGSGARAN